ncbi:hypothetical protein [Limosilactobacillus equigenerosi]|uniref:hypothetical protein n=1 Tax=Limosilactobacillus equigenerosi TaxID=417373 RepID=UPI0006D2C439|nr:hypothetical protein [Limosilactobacillus equigenerosi]
MNNQLIETIVESIKNSNQSLTKLIITPATMRNDLELSIFQSLADSQQEIVFATDKIFVRTFEELATATLAGEIPVVSYPLLTSSVRLQIIEESLKSTQSKLKVFKKSALKLGFIRKVSQLFEQFDQNAWTPAVVDELAQIVKKTNLSLSNKLADLALVYHHFYPQLANYQTKSKLIDVLSEQVGLLGDYQLIYVGESILTDAHEARLLQVLQANAQQSDLYSFPTWQTFTNHPGVIKTTKKVELPGSSETNSLFEQVNLLAPKTNLINTERFEVGKALDKPLEARWVASQIHHLVTDKTKSVRLRDIVVFLPTGDRFLSRQLSQELNKLNLDHNNYETTTLTNTPLSNVIQSILAPVELRYTIKNIERLLNSGLILANLATDTTNVKSQMIANRWVRQQFINHLKQNQIETEMDWKNDDMWTVLNQDDGLINSDKTDNLHAIRQRVQGLFEQVNEERLVASLIELLTTENPAEGQFSLLTIDKRQASNLTWYLKKYDKDAEQQLNLVSPKTGMGSLMTETRHRIIDLLLYLVGQPMTSSQLSQKN